MAIYVSPQDLLTDLRTNRPIKIKVFNLGENLGMDFAYYCHYMALRKLFPNVSITLARSNVDETNCIGLDKWQGKVVLPINDLQMAVVSQRYGDGRDWVNHLQDGHFHIVPLSFRNVDGYDYICGIGIGESPIWLKQYPDKKVINTSIILAVVEQHLNESGYIGDGTPLDLGEHTQIKPWSRTLLEYFNINDQTYPFTFTPQYIAHINPQQYSDYIRLSLRWPDHVRWYYSIDRQFEVVYDILKKIKEAGKPVKVMYSLKDGEIGNNFNRGQTLDKLRRIVDLSDDFLFTYSWPLRPYHARAPEWVERGKLATIGITGDKVKQVDVWEDLLISSYCKTYLSDPGGFAEIISILRRNRADSTFLFPVSFGHLCTYITLNRNREPIALKINKEVVDMSYDCQATLSAPDDPEGYRTIYWTLKYKDDIRQIGENNHGDDWKYFEEAQHTVFKDWYERSKDQLINEVVKQHIKE